jgi:arylsulfatase A-like enzyme
MSDRRPNVLLIVSDDHGYGDFTRLGHDPRVVTPHLDALAAGGVSCAQAYVTAPICSPSRAGLISGCYQQRWGAHWFGDSRFPDELPSLAERFGALGYATGYMGKVHYGPERPGDRACPPEHGFAESYYGLAGGQQGRLNYLRHSHAAVAEYGAEASWRMGVQPLWDGDAEVELEGFLTPELGRRAREFVTRHAGEPFFLMVAFNAVHNFCWQLPDVELDRRELPRHADWDERARAYDDWYDDAIWPNLPHGRDYYRAQLELMDAEIGKLLGTLGRHGLDEDTLIVYLTDNGGSTCNLGDNTPLRGGKYTLWEGGIRVPLIARWPRGGISGGRTTDALISALDLYPTLLRAAGSDASAWSHVDGIDQLATLRGEPTYGHEALHWDCGFQWAVREGPWKLSHVELGDEVARFRRRQHVDMGEGTRLVNLADDLAESVDLAAVYPDVVELLSARHRQWRELTIGG